jgi:hypothetical protein
MGTIYGGGYEPEEQSAGWECPLDDCSSLSDFVGSADGVLGMIVASFKIITLEITWLRI